MIQLLPFFQCNAGSYSPTYTSLSWPTEHGEPSGFQVKLRFLSKHRAVVQPLQDWSVSSSSVEMNFI